MNDRRIAWLSFALAVFVLFLLTLFVLLPDASANGQTIQFNGQTVDLTGASTVTIQSQNEVSTYKTVTVNTSTITITIWRKP